MTIPCTLQDAVGRVEACPGETCPFWDGGEARCLFEAVRSELVRSPALAANLLELRLALDPARREGHGDAVRSLFYRLLNDEQRSSA